MPSVFVFSLLPLYYRVWASDFWDCFADSWNTNMTWMRNVSYSLALKWASMMKKRGTLVFFTLAGSRRKHLSPLSSAQIRCLYLFRVEEINPEWSTVGQRERKTKEKEMAERAKGQGSSLVFNCLCVSGGADGIYWRSIPARSGDWERWPPAPTPFQPPPAALFPASTCPPPALIHSHYETACIMLSNRNNPQEMEHPMYSRGGRWQRAANKRTI